MKTVYLSLGSNLGDREANLAEARARLEPAGIRVVAASSLYETEPQGLADQGWFLNQVVQAETALFPRQLLARLKKLEAAMGRRPAVRNGPRVIDVDILLYGNAVVGSEELEIPHPRMGERRFVLAPLAEIAPALRHPVTGAGVGQMLAAVRGQAVRKR